MSPFSITFFSHDKKNLSITLFTYDKNPIFLTKKLSTFDYNFLKFFAPRNSKNHVRKYFYIFLFKKYTSYRRDYPNGTEQVYFSRVGKIQVT